MIIFLVTNSEPVINILTFQHCQTFDSNQNLVAVTIINFIVLSVCKKIAEQIICLVHILMTLNDFSMFSHYV